MLEISEVGKQREVSSQTSLLGERHPRNTAQHCPLTSISICTHMYVYRHIQVYATCTHSHTIGYQLAMKTTVPMHQQHG